jgi:hypothetical protein
VSNEDEAAREWYVEVYLPHQEELRKEAPSLEDMGWDSEYELLEMYLDVIREVLDRTGPEECGGVRVGRHPHPLVLDAGTAKDELSTTDALKAINQGKPIRVWCEICGYERTLVPGVDFDQNPW